MEIPVDKILKISAVISMIVGAIAWINASYLQTSVFYAYKETRKSEQISVLNLYNSDRIEIEIKLLEIHMALFELRLDDDKQLSVKQQSKYNRLQAALIKLEAAKTNAFQIH